MSDFYYAISGNPLNNNGITIRYGTRNYKVDYTDDEISFNKFETILDDRFLVYNDEIIVNNSSSNSSSGITSIGLSMPGGFSVSNSPLVNDGSIDVTTTLNGIIKGDGSSFSAAVPGVDYINTTSAISTSQLSGYISSYNLIGPISGQLLTGTIPSSVLPDVAVSDQNYIINNITNYYVDKKGRVTSVTSGNPFATGSFFPLSYRWSLGVGSVVATGIDKTSWYTIERKGTLEKVFLTAKIPPSGSVFECDIYRSTNNGSTWQSIYLSNNRPQIATGVFVGSHNLFAVGGASGTTTINQGDLLRLDVTQVGSTYPGQDITIQLLTLTGNS